MTTRFSTQKHDETLQCAHIWWHASLHKPMTARKCANLWRHASVHKNMTTRFTGQTYDDTHQWTRISGHAHTMYDDTLQCTETCISAQTGDAYLVMMQPQHNVLNFVSCEIFCMGLYCCCIMGTQWLFIFFIYPHRKPTEKSNHCRTSRKKIGIASTLSAIR